MNRPRGLRVQGRLELGECVSKINQTLRGQLEGLVGEGLVGTARNTALRSSSLE